MELTHLELQGGKLDLMKALTTYKADITALQELRTRNGTPNGITESQMDHVLWDGCEINGGSGTRLQLRPLPSQSTNTLENILKNDKTEALQNPATAMTYSQELTTKIVMLPEDRRTSEMCEEVVKTTGTEILGMKPPLWQRGWINEEDDRTVAEPM